MSWKEHLIKSTKICPIGKPKIKTIEIVVTDPETEKEICECCDDIDNTVRHICIIYKFATSIIGLLFILWGIGFITLLMLLVLMPMEILPWNLIPAACFVAL